MYVYILLNFARPGLLTNAVIDTVVWSVSYYPSDGLVPGSKPGQRRGKSHLLRPTYVIDGTTHTHSGVCSTSRAVFNKAPSQLGDWEIKNGNEQKSLTPHPEIRVWEPAKKSRFFVCVATPSWARHTIRVGSNTSGFSAAPPNLLPFYSPLQ